MTAPQRSSLAAPSPHINAIGTALPAHDVHAAFVTYAGLLLDDRRTRLAFERMSRRSGISHRWSSLRPGRVTEGEVDDGGFYRRGAFPTTGARMQLYEAEGVPLAIRAVEALGRDVSDVTHLVVASCTGFAAPGVDQRLIEHFGLSDMVARSQLGFMGCSAAVPALRSAFHQVRSDPTARVLVVNLELCTLHMQDTDDLETILCFLLFGDAASAALVTAEPEGIALERFQTRLLPDSAGHITWHVGDHGFRMHLSGQVPKAIEHALGQDLVRNDGRDLRGGTPIDEVALWAVHAGGRSVLDAVETGYGLDSEALRFSRATLDAIGNVSSATIMFVLAKMLADKARGRGMGLAFGPGVTAESFGFTAYG